MILCGRGEVFVTYADPTQFSNAPLGRGRHSRCFRDTFSRKGDQL